MPAPFVKRSVRAAASASTAASVRRFRSSVGNIRASRSTGSMQVRIRVPACWISVSSSLKSMKSVSTTMSASLSTSTAGWWPLSGVLPTVHTPTSPDVADDEYGSRRFITLAPSRWPAVRNASTYSARSSPCESTMKLSPSRSLQSRSIRSQRSVNIDWLNDCDPIESFLGSGRYSV